MEIKIIFNGAVLGLLLATGVYTQAADITEEYTFEAGHPSLQKWLLPNFPPAPADNLITSDRVELGKSLFFDIRLSDNQTMSCGSCHVPSLGWGDGKAFSKGADGGTLGRTTPTIVNMAYNNIFMWDGRAATLEEQVLGPITSSAEMNLSLPDLTALVSSDSVYQQQFSNAYPGEEISPQSIGKALASFVRTVVSNDSPFDRWIKGDPDAMTEQQVNGFKLFLDESKGNCVACHHAPNFTDSGFHNLGLADDLQSEDPGRYAIKPVRLMKGAFKTPTLRDVTLTAPYFHDGSANTLEDVMQHYISGGNKNATLSPNMKALELNEAETASLISFIKALTSPQSSLTPSTVAMNRE